MKYIRLPLLIMILQLFTACISDEDRRLNETLAFAGDNREELEKVLSYYEDKGETQKWKAARLLIANMKDKFSYDIPDLDSIRQALVDVKTQNVWDERWKGYKYKQLPKIYDAQVISDTAFTERVGCKIIPGADSSYKDFYRASDDDWLTYYWVYTRGASLVLDLGKSTKIGSFLFVPRNDDNYVKKGEYYELMYQNGANGWASLGRKVAEDDFIEFDDVPANALLRLHHCTKGIEEQVFLWKDGKQYFLGHLR